MIPSHFPFPPLPFLGRCGRDAWWAVDGRKPAGWQDFSDIYMCCCSSLEASRLVFYLWPDFSDIWDVVSWYIYEFVSWWYNMMLSHKQLFRCRSLAAPVWVVQPQALFQESDVQEDLQVNSFNLDTSITTITPNHHHHHHHAQPS